MKITVSSAAAGAPSAATLHIESSGCGSPVIFWHGWAMNLRVFDALRATLSPDYLTCAVDLPGHGRSAWPVRATSPDCAALETWLPPLLATLPANATLVAWSLGGQFALRAAVLAPERVARLVLINSTPRFLRSPDWPHGVDPALLVQLRQRLTSDVAGMLGDFLELQLRGSRAGPELLRTLRMALQTQGEAVPAALDAGLTLLAQTDLRSLLPQVRQPVLVIGGQYDRITPPAAAAALAAAVPRGAYREFARAAHAPFLSHAAQFASLLRTFISEADAR
jgi:pimeloyl-[acyl-carrier protein] methyl ester esterase